MVGSASGFTAEAWELDRRDRLHKQLKLARRIRMDLEAACNEAENGSVHRAREIFTSKVDRMNELVSLTKAVLGKYTLKSYKNYSVADSKEEQIKLNAHSEALSVLSNHRKAMAYERDPSIHEQDIILQKMEKERKAKEMAIVSKKVKPLTERARIPRKLPPRVINTTSTPKGRPLSQSSHTPPKISPPQDETHIKKKRRTVAVGQNIIIQEKETRAPPQSNRKRPSPTKQLVEKSLPSKSHSGAKAMNVPPRKAISRKCHYCKKSSSAFRQCHFYFITGDKCRKCYCMECLVAHFDFKENKKMRDEDWHCPSCLGNCTCSVCVRKRERERAREPRPGRRTSSRTKY